MKIVMTLRTRDEADIVDAQIAFHLNAGVDFVVATDNGSTDGTIEILESYARLDYLHLIRDDGMGVRKEGNWVTRMARLAATEFEADWVINSDADEFFWPRGPLKDLLGAVPRRFGVVRAMVRHFAPRPDTGESFAERMTTRVCNPGAYSNSPYSPRFKAIHRGDKDVTVGPGNHQAFGAGLYPLRGWYPVDMLHFPIRSLRQCERKFLRWWELFPDARNSVWSAAHDAKRADRMREFYESFVVDDEALEKGVADGTLAVDTRLRDALRTLHAGGGSTHHEFALPRDSAPLTFADRTVDEGYLSELAATEQTDSFTQAQRRLEGMEKRVASLERSPLRNALRRMTPEPWLASKA